MDWEDSHWLFKIFNEMPFSERAHQEMEKEVAGDVWYNSGQIALVCYVSLLFLH